MSLHDGHQPITAEPPAVPPAQAPTRKRPVTVAFGLFRSLRPKQWAKNVFVFAGVVFAERLRDADAVLTSLAAFGIFCALSGAAYLVNDALDVEQDRRHPRKRRRPIAAGIVPLGLAVGSAVALGAGGLITSWLVNPGFAGISLAFLALTLGYSYAFKHVILIDVIALAIGYVLRAAGGAIAIDVPVSPWLLLCTILLALFIGITKRRHELLTLDNAGEHRRILDEYSGPLLDQMISLVASSMLIAYSLYTFFSDTAHGGTRLVVTLPFVVYGLFRYLYLVYKRGEGGSPEDLVFSDLPLLGCLALWAGTIVVLLYLF